MGAIHESFTALLRQTLGAVYRRAGRWFPNPGERFGWDLLGAQGQAAVLRDLAQSDASNAPLYASPRAGGLLLPRMLAVFGLEATLSRSGCRAIRRDLERVCGQCPHQRQCERVLRHAPTRAECGFCPNHYSLESLRREPAHGI